MLNRGTHRGHLARPAPPGRLRRPWLCDHGVGQGDRVVGYLWNGTAHDRRDHVADLASRIPSLRAVGGVGNLGAGNLDEHHQIANLTTWEGVTSGDIPPEFVRVDFDTPLWVLYSSGTTGILKGIVHSHGGVVIDHLRLLGLHHDLRPGERFFWYTNCMMWNLVASALVAGVTTACFDGSPLSSTPVPVGCGRSPRTPKSTSSGSVPGSS